MIDCVAQALLPVRGYFRARCRQLPRAAPREKQERAHSQEWLCYDSRGRIGRSAPAAGSGAVGQAILLVARAVGVGPPRSRGLGKGRVFHRRCFSSSRRPGNTARQGNMGSSPDSFPGPWVLRRVREKGRTSLVPAKPGLGTGSGVTLRPFCPCRTGTRAGASAGGSFPARQRSAPQLLQIRGNVGFAAAGLDAAAQALEKRMRHAHQGVADEASFAPRLDEPRRLH